MALIPPGLSEEKQVAYAIAHGYDGLSDKAVDWWMLWGALIISILVFLASFCFYAQNYARSAKQDAGVETYNIWTDGSYTIEQVQVTRFHSTYTDASLTETYKGTISTKLTREPQGSDIFTFIPPNAVRMDYEGESYYYHIDDIKIKKKTSNISLPARIGGGIKRGAGNFFANVSYTLSHIREGGLDPIIVPFVQINTLAFWLQFALMLLFLFVFYCFLVIAPPFPDFRSYAVSVGGLVMLGGVVILAALLLKGMFGDENLFLLEKNLGPHLSEVVFFSQPSRSIVKGLTASIQDGPRFNDDEIYGLWLFHKVFLAGIGIDLLRLTLKNLRRIWMVPLVFAASALSCLWLGLIGIMASFTVILLLVLAAAGIFLVVLGFLAGGSALKGERGLKKGEMYARQTIDENGNAEFKYDCWRGY